MAACEAPSASWWAPLAAVPSWSLRLVKPRNTFLRYCDDSVLPKTEEAVDASCAVIAPSTTRASGAVCTPMVAFSGVSPGRVESEAAVKFSGIVTTAV